MDKIALKSYAKINLFLKVVDKRTDGYHNIETIFQTINLADDVIVEKHKNGILINCNNDDIPFDEQNIAYVSAKKILTYRNISSGVKVIINKNIPVAAGLGGGSSNAAAVLNGINKLYDLKLSFKELFKIAVECGSDVPFLLKGGTAFGQGVGEVLDFLTPLKNIYFVLVNPGFSVSTKLIYDKIKLTKNNKFDNKINRIKKTKSIKGGDLSGILHNDLESVTSRIFPVIKEIKECLRVSGALDSLMSGSGPTVFGLAKSKEDAQKIYEDVKNNYNWVYIAETKGGRFNGDH